MERLIHKYEQKILKQKIAEPENLIIGGLDAELIWNRQDKKIKPVLEKVIAGININSIMFARPTQPYFSMINHLIKRLPKTERALCPQDNENRLFLHELPIADSFCADEIINALKKRKCVIIPNEGIITYGTISPEQCFIVYSSVLFSLFVKAFVDYWHDFKADKIDPVMTELIKKAKQFYNPLLKQAFNYPPIRRGPFDNAEDVIKAICEAGRLTVDKYMVDSFFGNISYRLDNIIYVTQTTSTLDELEGYIDPCPVDDSMCTAITASSEYKAHKEVYLSSDCKAILHGHPKFCVIASMLCNEKNTCKNNTVCHIKCQKKRHIGNVPICPGESGTGPTSIAKNLPPVLSKNDTAIIYGHGIFTRGKNDFTQAFKNLVEIEKMCFENYFEQVGLVD